MPHKLSALTVISAYALLATGCMTFSGEQLPSLEPITPQVSPSIETSVSPDYQYHIDVLQVITGNKDGRMVNDRVIEMPWKDNGYISEATYVKLEDFTGEADYNLTLSGSHTVDSSVGGQIISGLTLGIIPFTVDQEYNLVYKLEQVKTGKVYTVNAYQTESMVNWSPFIVAFPVSLLGSMNAIDDLSEYVYQEFVKQGAFQLESHEATHPIPPSDVTHKSKDRVSDDLVEQPILSPDGAEAQTEALDTPHSSLTDPQLEAIVAAPNTPPPAEPPIDQPKIPAAIEPEDPRLAECIQNWQRSAWYAINRQNISEQLDQQGQNLQELEQKIRQACKQDIIGS